MYGLILRQAGLKKKAVGIYNAPQRLTQRIGEFEKKILALDERVQAILKANGHLVFADESVFVARGYQNRAWSQPNDNIVIQDRTSTQDCQAVCAGVCKCHGLLNFII
jgi:hypothetical protein